MIILSNEFASLYQNPDADNAIASCVAILRYCASADAQAHRVVYIIEAFHEAILTRPTATESTSYPKRMVPVITPMSHSVHQDPMARFFAHIRTSPEQRLPILAPSMGRACPNNPTAHTGSIPRLLSSVLQQPSPEDVTGSSPLCPPGMTTESSVIEQTHASETAFNFDDLWPNWHSPGSAVPIGHHVEPVETYSPFTLNQPALELGNAMIGHANMSVYPPCDYP